MHRIDPGALGGNSKDFSHIGRFWGAIFGQLTGRFFRYGSIGIQVFYTYALFKNPNRAIFGRLFSRFELPPFARAASPGIFSYS